MQSLIVIPARMGSTRFPGKPLCDLLGKPMLQWVVEAAQRSGAADRVVVATPDHEILNACRDFGVDAIMTSSLHPSGTDRIAEVAKTLEADVYINVQGDEPLIHAESILACARPLFDNPTIEIGTVCSDCNNEDLDNPAVVKVVTDLAGFALYFSRYPIPFPRNPRSTPAKKHVGIYAYRRAPLLSFTSWPQGDLELSEGLEQLRFMEHGIRICVSKGAGAELAVDTPEQAEEVRRLLARRQAGV
jgi:3-deoxy-manno-octulosonate cytidylyltransferase (CMP-KDO synthetase)